MEKITIENFSGIKSMEFDIKSINLFIGAQGTGKSISIKLLFFFKNFFNNLYRNILAEDGKRELDKKQKDIFLNYFPKESWGKDNFKITYTVDATWLKIESNNNVLNFTYSDNIKSILNKTKNISTKKEFLYDSFNRTKAGISITDKSKVSNIQKIRIPRLDKNKLSEYISKETSTIAKYEQYFIPAGRSFFANLQSTIFSILSENRSLDPFLIQFGSFYEMFKRFYDNDIDKDFQNIVNEILDSDYVKEKDKDFLVHADNRKVNVANASSGQQEVLPLLIVLQSFNGFLFKDTATIYIEEPEAHLFPTAQKRIVQLLARIFNKNNNFQIIVTTHSPYILSSFNNLLQAGHLAEQRPNKKTAINKIIPKEEQITSNVLTAYSLANGKSKSIIDKETNLISQTLLDEISNEIAIEFGKLLDIEYEK